MKTKNDSGMVLVLVVCLAAAAGVLAAGLFSATASQVKRTRRYLNHEQAFYIAEAGIEQAASVLDGTNDLNNVLLNGIASVASVSFGGGTFQVNVRDNDDGDGDWFSDTDSTVIICSTGLYENAVRVIETQVTIPFLDIIPPDVDAPLAYYGSNSTLTLIGTGGKIDGNDFEIPANFNCSGHNCWGPLTTNPAAPSSVYTVTNLTVTGESKIEAPPPVRIITGGGLYDETYWTTLVNELLPLADLTISGTASYAGNTHPIGTRIDPTITVVTTNSVLNITGGVDGAGIMILQTGSQFNSGGNFHYEGIIIAFGSAATEITGHGTPMISGAVVCMGEGDISFSGAGGIRYSSEALANLSNLNPSSNSVSIVYWREMK